MNKLLLYIILISIIFGLYNDNELIACHLCCGKECISYEESHDKKLTKTECEKMINDCYDWWNKGFIAARMDKMKKN